MSDEVSTPFENGSLCAQIGNGSLCDQVGNNNDINTVNTGTNVNDSMTQCAPPSNANVNDRVTFNHLSVMERRQMIKRARHTPHRTKDASQKYQKRDGDGQSESSSDDSSCRSSSSSSSSSLSPSANPSADPSTKSAESDEMRKEHGHDEPEKEYGHGGYHRAYVGDVLHGGKYVLEKKLGFGYFSTVWLASDTTKHVSDPNKCVAIKISKSKDTFLEAAEDEVVFLEKLKDTVFSTRLLDKFVLWGPNGKHYCLVFEMMWKDVLYLIRKFNYKGLPVKLIKVIAYQVLCGMEEMHSHNIIHTDVKPENFLISLPYDLNIDALSAEREEYKRTRAQHQKWTSYFERTNSMRTMNKNQRRRMAEKTKTINISSVPSPETLREMANTCYRLQRMNPPTELDKSKNLVIKVADFGNACWTHKHNSSDISTRQYRSPEALLGYPYSTGVDIFSCGCMFFELATGTYLFSPKRGSDINRRNEVHLAQMQETIGIIPRYMIQEGKYGRNYFNRRCEFLHEHVAASTNPLSSLLQHHKFDPTEIKMFADFLSHLVDLNPKTRWTATMAKRHPWLEAVHLDYEKRGLSVFKLQ